MKRNRSRKTATPAIDAAGRFEEAALFEFSKVINSSVDPDFIYSHILLTIMGKILSTRGMLLIKAGEKFVVQTVKGFPADVVGESVVVKKTPASLFSLDGITPGRYPWVTYFRSHDVNIVLPMHIAGKAIGLLAFGPRLAPRKLQSHEVTFLRSLANISATAVETSRTVEELRQVNRELDRKIQELNTLFELGKEFGREFGALLERDKLVRLLIFSLLGQIMVNRYLICLKDGPDMTVVASRIDGQAPLNQLLNSLTHLKTPTLVSDLVIRHAEDPRPVLSSLGLAVVVPMQFQGECKGLVMLGEKLSREPFKQADLDLLFSLGNLAIISLENARLFKETLEKQKLEDELMIAREIQKGLLPTVPP